MIDETRTGTNYCYECDKLIYNDNAYCIAHFGGQQIATFKNGDKHIIAFCLSCWNKIAGQKYTFNK